MNQHSFKRNGLSARLRTICSTNVISRVLHLFRNTTAWILALIICVCISSCQEKTKGQELSAKGKQNTTTRQDSVNKPHVNVKVNKRYDDKGNLIGMDSTYSSFYSNIQGDTSRMDSLFHSFDRYFNRNHSSFLPKEFDALFFNDSLRYPDFLHHDFFLKRYEMNDAYFRDMMHRMDSIKNNFYLQQHHKKGKKSADL
jgi:hypothetical protein